jgi:hypothetical protein
MIYSKIAQKPQAGKGFQPKFEYRLNKGLYAQKLTLNVKTEETSTGILLYGPVIVQMTESEEYVYEEDLVSEQFLELGFWSKSVATVITGWRLRVPEAAQCPEGQKNLPALVDLVAYG